ncbi:MAG TPA: DedA family protein [Acidimicrobiales bacterium]|nr:DedA family protein [Acidimicrobiales bacterium]HUB69220.1 DedA family protein [Acidimicrobiales bacterium]
MLALLNPTSFVTSSGYAAIFLLCVLQSCCVPTSSELTLGIAGVLAAEGKLNLLAVILLGALGEVIGSYIAWVIGRTFGRAFVDRFGKYLLLSHQDLDRAEAWFRGHGNWGVFVSRLVPVVRSFVALPAGVAEVPLLRFGLLTAAGSIVWDTAMASIGYEVGSRWKSVMHGVTDAGYILAVLVVLAIAVFLLHRYRSYKAATTGGGAHWEAGRAGGAHSRGGRRGPAGPGGAGGVDDASIQPGEGEQLDPPAGPGVGGVSPRRRP